MAELSNLKTQLKPSAHPVAGVQHQLLTPDEVIRILRLAAHAPRAPREALRNLVRHGKLSCLRSGPGKRGRMVFLRRHVEECLARWERWGQFPPLPPPEEATPGEKETLGNQESQRPPDAAIR